MQVSEQAVVTENLKTSALFNSLEACGIPQETTLDEDKKRQFRTCYNQASILPLSAEK